MNSNTSANTSANPQEWGEFNIDDIMFRDFGSIPPEAISQSTSTFEEPRYRAASVLPSYGYGISSSLMAPSSSSYYDNNNAMNLSVPLLSSKLEKPSLKKGSTTISTFGNIIIQSTSTKESTVQLRDCPSYLFPTHFSCCENLDEIRTVISNILEGIHEISFEFHPNNCQWTGVFVRGSNFCKFEINVYLDSVKYIIEAARIKGDACVFHQVYRDVKAAFAEPCMEDYSRYDSFVMTNHIPMCEIPFTETEASIALQQILVMAGNTSIDSRLEACKLLCDMSQNEQYLDQFRDAGCIAILSKLASCECNCTKRNAILALANLSESPCCQEAILDSGVIPTLMNLCADGCCQTTELRRASARLLANISSRLALRIAQSIDQHQLTKWFDSVDSINDSKLRLHAERARDALRPCLSAS